MTALCNYDKTLEHLDANCTGAEFSISKMLNNQKFNFLNLTTVARLSLSSYFIQFKKLKFIT